MKEGTLILENIDAFNMIITNIVSIEVKLDEDDKAFILLNSLLPSYKHLGDHYSLQEMNSRDGGHYNDTPIG